MTATLAYEPAATEATTDPPELYAWTVPDERAFAIDLGLLPIGPSEFAAVHEVNDILVPPSEDEEYAQKEPEAHEPTAANVA